MKARTRKLTGGTLAAALFAVSVGPTFVMASSATNHTTGLREVERPITTEKAPEVSGFFSWLESLLPKEMRFTGPAIFSKTQPEVITTATCYDSGAGVSCNGFRNMQEYLAAVHASQNLGIPFERLKERMQSGKTLHQAIRELRPAVNAQIEATRARQQAASTLRESSS